MSVEAVYRQRLRKRPAEVIEDLEWILATEGPERAADRLGYVDARTLRAALAGWGRRDLADAVKPPDGRARRGRAAA